VRRCFVVVDLGEKNAVRTNAATGVDVGVAGYIYQFYIFLVVFVLLCFTALG
jgi:hypothetical protein